MSTKIHTTVDALGNPTGFYLTPGQAHDLEGADVLLKETPAAALLADKAYDADSRVIEPLLMAGKTVVISPPSISPALSFGSIDDRSQAKGARGAKSGAYTGVNPLSSLAPGPESVWSPS